MNSVDYRIYNVKPARTCIEEGESEGHELRLFEIGWGGDGIVFVRVPLILTAAAGAARARVGTNLGADGPAGASHRAPA